MEGDPRVDEIMMQIDKHLKDEDHVQHYNRTYEAIYDAWPHTCETCVMMEICRVWKFVRTNRESYMTKLDMPKFGCTFHKGKP